MSLSTESWLGRLTKKISTSPNLFLIQEAPHQVLADIGSLPAEIGVPAFIAYENWSNWLAIGTGGVAGRNHDVALCVPFNSVTACGPVNLGPKHELQAEFDTFRFALRNGEHVDSWFPRGNAEFFSLWSAIKMMIEGCN